VVDELMRTGWVDGNRCFSSYSKGVKGVLGGIRLYSLHDA